MLVFFVIAYKRRDPIRVGSIFWLQFPFACTPKILSDIKSLVRSISVCALVKFQHKLESSVTFALPICLCSDKAKLSEEESRKSGEAACGTNPGCKSQRVIVSSALRPSCFQSGGEMVRGENCHPRRPRSILGVKTGNGLTP